MGAGLELAMACHWRIAVDEPKTRIALPEVKLGLLSAAGGTQRMIKLLPIRKALEMLLTGGRGQITFFPFLTSTFLFREVRGSRGGVEDGIG
jgi:Enoyl-CoA hydratase/isomerase